jgi:hypothetical protein
MDTSHCETGINDFFKATSLRLSATILSRMFIRYPDRSRGARLFLVMIQSLAQI